MAVFSFPVAHRRLSLAEWARSQPGAPPMQSSKQLQEHDQHHCHDQCRKEQYEDQQLREPSQTEQLVQMLATHLKKSINAAVCSMPDENQPVRDGGCKMDEETMSPTQFCDDSGSQSSNLEDSDASTVDSDAEIRVVLHHICPTCHEKFPSAELVRTHWLDIHSDSNQKQSDPYKPVASEDARPVARQVDSKVPAPAATVQAVQCIECDAEGKPAIVRQTDEETGALRTIVFNADGSQRVFGEKTVTSMADSEESVIAGWIGGMTDLHLKGLVHEVTDRACFGSDLYYRRKGEVEAKRHQLNFSYFQLPAEAGQKDLDGVYRKLARSMHPDKNGGTEHAKEAFQGMKKRYESLKTHIATAGTPTSAKLGLRPKQQNQQQKQHQEHQPQQPVTCVEELHREQAGEKPLLQPHYMEDAQPLGHLQPDNQERGNVSPTSRVAQQHEACDEQDGTHKHEQEPVQEVINAQSQNRAELEKAAWQMLRTLRAVRAGMATLQQEVDEVEHDERAFMQSDV